ncbi:MAG: ABC transporter substrate-binding protein, partial [Haloarculaceae archaeon]
MRRRTYLTASLAAAAGLAGCEDLIDEGLETEEGPDSERTQTEQGPDDGSGESDPRLEIAEQFLLAVATRDGDAATERLHPESPLSAVDFDDEAATDIEDALVSESEVLEEGEDSATVRIVLRLLIDGSEETEEVGLELRQSDGAWTVWDFAPVQDRSPPNAPQVSFGVEYNSDDGTLVITHEAGDAVTASNLSVYGDGIAQTGTWEELGGSTSGTSGGEPTVAAGDRVTVDVSAEYSVRVVWESGQDSATLVSETGSADEETAGVRIGVLVNLSGSLSEDGAQVASGFLSGLAYKDGATPPEWKGAGEYELTVGEQPVSVLVRDAETNPNRTASVASELTTSEDVDVLFGGGTAAGALPVSRIAEQQQVPYLACPVATTELTGESCNEFVFRTTATSAMMARTGARYIVEETDIDRVALVANDFAMGQEWIENYQQTLAAGNVDVVFEEFVPLGNNSWGRVLENVESAGADAIVGGFIPNSQASFLQAFLAADPDVQFLSHFWTAAGLRGPGSVLEDALGSNFTAQDVREANVGPFVTRYHWNQFDNPVNDWFVDAHTDVYGTVPDT